MDYNEVLDKFSEPYIIAGHASKAGYVDGVGGNARVNGPGQGVFVKMKIIQVQRMNMTSISPMNITIVYEY